MKRNPPESPHEPDGLGVVATGTLAIRRKKKTTEDYLIASRAVSPWLSALLAVGTNNSGFMFIGMNGYTYRLGIESIWMMFGWVIGWLFVHPRVRRSSDDTGVETLPELIGTRPKNDDRTIVVACGVVTLLSASCATRRAPFRHRARSRSSACVTREVLTTTAQPTTLNHR